MHEVSLSQEDIFWQVGPITLMMEAAGISETSVNLYQTTWCNIPEVIFAIAAVRT
jgi:hypothetical protein